MKKILLLILSVLFLQTVCTAKDTLMFTFPNDGWHKVQSPDGIAGKNCYVPAEQSSGNFSEMLTLTEKNTQVSASAVLHKQLGKDRVNFYDIVPQYVVNDLDNAIVTWCSKSRNVCTVERAFKGTSGVILAIYTNKAPHYSQNMFSQWINNLGRIEVYDKTKAYEKPVNFIELQ